MTKNLEFIDTRCHVSIGIYCDVKLATIVQIRHTLVHRNHSAVEHSRVVQCAGGEKVLRSLAALVIDITRPSVVSYPYAANANKSRDVQASIIICYRLHLNENLSGKGVRFIIAIVQSFSRKRLPGGSNMRLEPLHLPLGHRRRRHLSE